MHGFKNNTNNKQRFVSRQILHWPQSNTRDNEKADMTPKHKQRQHVSTKEQQQEMKVKTEKKKEKREAFNDGRISITISG